VQASGIERVVSVEVAEDAAGTLPERHIEGMGVTAIFLDVEAKDVREPAGEFAGDLCSAVGRAAVLDDHFEIRVLLIHETLQGLTNKKPLVERGHGDADAREFGPDRRAGGFGTFDGRGPRQPHLGSGSFGRSTTDTRHSPRRFATPWCKSWTGAAFDRRSTAKVPTVGSRHRRTSRVSSSAWE